jgi:DNA-binding MarR family transcriptional regulator
MNKHYQDTLRYEEDTTLFNWAAAQTIAARRSDPQTSILAAEFIQARVSQREAEVLAALKEFGPQTSEEIAERLGRKHNNVSPRCAPLRGKGLIEQRGTVISKTTGRPAIVWALVEQQEQKQRRLEA